VTTIRSCTCVCEDRYIPLRLGSRTLIHIARKHRCVTATGIYTASECCRRRDTNVYNFAFFHSSSPIETLHRRRCTNNSRKCIALRRLVNCVCTGMQTPYSLSTRGSDGLLCVALATVVGGAMPVQSFDGIACR
jgi:hypothetical protein